jgi:hypothetical protein
MSAKLTLMTTETVPLNTWKIWIARYEDHESPEDHWSGHLGMQLVSDAHQRDGILEA